MKRAHAAGAALLALLLVVAMDTPRVAESSEPAAPDADAGRRIFSQNCARCHGFNMANPAPGILDLRTFPLEDKARFLAAVSEGKGAMPAWKDVLKPADIEAIWSYVNAVRNP
jgi:cytochrome c6